jgi:hypothetical protein
MEGADLKRLWEILSWGYNPQLILVMHSFWFFCWIVNKQFFPSNFFGCWVCSSLHIWVQSCCATVMKVTIVWRLLSDALSIICSVTMSHSCHA